MQNDYDILIVGGGMVGASLACALANSGYRIALLEARPLDIPRDTGTPGQVSHQASYDERTVALSYSSHQIFNGLDLWDELANMATPIKTIHISERGSFGKTRLHHHEHHVDALGYVIANRDVSQTLYARLLAQKNLKIYSGAYLESFALKTDSVRADVSFENKTGKKNLIQIKTRLLIAADGANSAVREQLGINMQRDAYDQTAIVTNVTPSLPHDGVAYERFTESGPLALLPLSDNRCSVVWTHDARDVDATLALDDGAFLQKLQQVFGYRLGKFTRVGTRQVYPLSLVRAKEMVRPRVALIGNAVHTLHPVAGQGFNLALRDVALLAELLHGSSRSPSYSEVSSSEKIRPDRDPGATDLLKRYAELRAQDLKRTIGFTDILARVFTNPLAPLARARSMGLVAVDLLTPLRNRLVQQSTGMRGGVTRLTSGLSLESHVLEGGARE